MTAQGIQPDHLSVWPQPSLNSERKVYAQRELRALLHPSSIAIVGASLRPGAFGERTLSNLADFEGRIYLVNERYDQIGERRCYPSLGALPEIPDCVVCAVPREAVQDIVTECVERGIPGIIVYASGYAETAIPQRVAQQTKLLETVAGSQTRLLGPNCVGTYNFLNRAHQMFGRTVGLRLSSHSKPSIGVVSQSGALGMALCQALRHGVAISHMLSPGNSLDVGIGDLIAYLAEDPECDAIACVFEGVEAPGRILQAAEICRVAGKPLVIYKTGRSEGGAQAALSHTGSVAGAYSGWRAVCERAGAVMVDDFEAIIETALFLAKAGKPGSGGVVVVSTSGGAGVIAADMSERFDVALPQPSANTLITLREQLPEFAALRNPCDVTAQVLNDDGPMRASALALLSDPLYDTAVVPHPFADAVGLSRVKLWAEVANQAGKMVCYLWCSEWLEGPGAAEIERLPNVALFRSASRCFQAISAWQRREKNLQYGSAQDRVQPESRARGLVQKMIQEQTALVATGRLSREIISCYGVPVLADVLLSERADCVAAAHALGYPVVLKLESPDIPHKTDAGGVQLDLRSDQELLAAYDKIIAAAKEIPTARITGVLIQPMVTSGTELMIGARVDSQVGPLVLVGEGGIDVEIFRDVQVAAAPVGMAQARQMLATLKCFPKLRGHRGRIPADIDTIAEAICRVSELIADHRDSISEIDVNPLICSAASVVAVDSLVVFGRALSKGLQNE